MPAHALRVRRLGIVAHPTRDVGRALGHVLGWAAERGAEVVQVGVDGRRRDVAPRDGAAGCDVLVAVGGDGTVLAALRASAPVGCPVLGIACGSLGALTAVDPSGVVEALEAVEDGTWRPRPVPALVAVPESGAEVRAFNDLVVVRAAGSQVVADVEVGGERFGRWAGDGVAVATPFGSTAYNLALGGPLVMPGSDVLVVTAIAPHGGSLPSLVVPAGTTLRVSVAGGHGGTRVELDGRPATLDVGSIAVRLVQDAATLVRLDDGEPFLAGLRRRGIVADSPRVLAGDRRAAARAQAAP